MFENQNDSCVLTYELDGKKYFEVKVQKRDKFGKVRKKSSRFTKAGKRITSQAGVTQVRAWLREEILVKLSHKSRYTWQQWKNRAVQKMRRDGLKESTLTNYDGLVDRWKDPSWSDLYLSQIDRQTVYDYFHQFLVNKGATDWTRRNLHKRLHRIFELAVDEGEISKNPARGIKIVARSDEGIAFTATEVEKLLSMAKISRHPYYPHWVVALLTGLRNGELFALRYEKVNFDSNTILIDEQFTSKDGLHHPKAGKTRTIDLGPELRKFIIELRGSIGPQSARLWKHTRNPVEVDEVVGGSKTGRRIMSLDLVKEYVHYDDLILPRIRTWTKGNQAKELKDFCHKIGIREAKFHDLRATHITNLLSNGISISKVMHQVGHSQMSTTDAYHRLAGVEVKGITKSLGFSIPEAKKPESPDNVISLFQKKTIL